MRVQVPAIYTRLSTKVQTELQAVDLEGCNISIEESVRMIKFLEDRLSELREYFIVLKSISVEGEITFFKEIKPEVLGADSRRRCLLF